jgi:hypothetical protein
LIAGTGVDGTEPPRSLTEMEADLLRLHLLQQYQLGTQSDEDCSARRSL